MRMLAATSDLTPEPATIVRRNGFPATLCLADWVQIGGQSGHLSRDCPSGRQGGGGGYGSGGYGGSSDRSCYNCGEAGFATDGSESPSAADILYADIFRVIASSLAPVVAVAAAMAARRARATTVRRTSTSRHSFPADPTDTQAVERDTSHATAASLAPRAAVEVAVPATTVSDSSDLARR